MSTGSNTKSDALGSNKSLFSEQNKVKICLELVIIYIHNLICLDGFCMLEESNDSLFLVVWPIAID